LLDLDKSIDRIKLLSKQIFKEIYDEMKRRIIYKRGRIIEEVENYLKRPKVFKY